MDDKMGRLRELLAEVEALASVGGVLAWDRETFMPEGGAAGRGDAMALIARLQHEAATSDELGSVLEELSSGASDLDPDSDDARLISVSKRDYDLERKLPAPLVEAVSHASSDGLVAWHRAREANDYALFADALKRNAELTRQVAEAYGYDEHPYDAFVGLFEPGMNTDQLTSIFAQLKETIVPLVREIAARKDMVDDSCLFQQYDHDRQFAVGLDIAARFGYELDRGRLDESAHPFTMGLNAGDVRITTRIFPDRLDEGLLSTLHEAGHAMYEQGVDPSLSSTPLAHGASAGMHESQSRLWENLVGRGRPFQDYQFPLLRETFPAQLSKVDIETFYKAINKVEPSLIRTAADEVTYNLHIMLRFELENDMLQDRVDISKLDNIWKERMEQYLGVVPEDDVHGVLQDIHWSTAGPYDFPGYTLGNIISAQLFRQAHKEMPDLDGQISNGEFVNLLGWLRTNVYIHGRKFTSNELMERITGEPVNTRAWIEYITGKFSGIYGL